MKKFLISFILSITCLLTTHLASASFIFNIYRPPNAVYTCTHAYTGLTLIYELRELNPLDLIVPNQFACSVDMLGNFHTPEWYSYTNIHHCRNVMQYVIHTNKLNGFYCSSQAWL